MSRFRCSSTLAGALMGVVSSSDGSPTRQSYDVYRVVSLELTNDLTKLRQLMTTTLPKINAMLRAAGLRFRRAYSGYDGRRYRPGATGRAWQTRLETEWEGHPVTVVSRSGLVELKRLRGSPQDIVDIALLEGQE